ncbi:MAG: transglycosylase domain-containing protein [Crocinitomicaceae bacterium]|jgi:penicillin-binding protein 1A|nr:transglycosylase domain-containing protein [Crocinitomicaceae bacterium]
MSKNSKNVKPEFSEEGKKKLRTFIWILGLFPLFLIVSLLLFQPDDELPPVAMLDNPPELLASVIYADDAETELGRYWKINRTSASYKEISPYVTDALISTEDERFDDHSGVDFKAVGRAVINLGSAGGASTITQQLAKQLFTLQQREREAEARAKGESISGSRGRISSLIGRINEKARENIIATRLEKRYTKEEIITMYLNQFDFLFNAVGIENAAKVYYNKKPADLGKEEAAMLIGMCKNPSVYNPHMFQVRNYARNIASEKGISIEKVDPKDIQAARSADSLLAAGRRNQVLYQWLKNSKEKNPALREYITREEYDSLKMLPIVTDYQQADHKQGIAPYFRESLRGELTSLLHEKNPDGTYKYTRPDGQPWNIYNDGLRIYTTINADMQTYAEEALKKHLGTELQAAFDRNNKSVKNFPFSNSLSSDQIESIMRKGRRSSTRYANALEMDKTAKEIEEEFNTPTAMRVFSWRGEIDTIMSPNDSIRYYKSFLHAGLLSMEPQTGFIKAWVGGANMDHFAYDHVRLGKRQVGSTIKPFVYATAINMGVIKPCNIIPNGPFCVDLEDGYGNVNGRWCPRGDAPVGESVAWCLANSNNPGTVYVMSKMGGYTGPKNIAKFLKDMRIDVREADQVPAMCLGPMDLSLYEMVPAQAMFVNQGIYIEPTTILRIEDRNGNVIYSAKPYSKEVLNQNVAYEVLKMMKGTVSFGTAGRLRWHPKYGGITAPTAGKTGTTQSNADGWFMGLTPELVTGVWVGAEDRGVRFRSTNEGQGANTALPIYGYFMQKVYKDANIALSTTDFEVPASYDPKQFSCGAGSSLPQPESPEPFL